MVFNSVTFLIFIVIFIPVFYLLEGRYRLIFTLICSCIFYGWWDWRFLGLLGFSTIVDYTLGRRMQDEENAAVRKRLLGISLIVNLGVLCFFKYFNFFVGSFNTLMGQIGMSTDSGVFNIILPVGISFYTFQSLSYTIDIYYRKIDAERDLLKFATFISFFPQLVAGPIVRASTFLPQFNDNKRKAIVQNLVSGLDLVVIGFIKKVLIADSLAPVVEGAFSSPASYSSIHLIVSLIFYSFQIYCDFSGYSDIAIGLARMLGFEFPKNFNIPYIATSFSDFWNRWHISLSTWLRDYLYIPLGGSRKGKFNTYKNLMITMLLGGLWHGANWTFIFWGFLHGMYLVIQRLLDSVYERFNLRPKQPFSRFVFNIGAGIIVYVAVCYAWIYFRSPDFATASMYVNGILAFDDMSVGSLVNKFWIVKGVLLITFLFLLELVSTKFEFADIFDKSPILRPTFYAAVLWCISLFGTFSESQFIYFQF